MTTLAVIVPTRGRPHTVAELVAAWEDTDAVATLILACDDDDPRLDDYRAAFNALDTSVDVQLDWGPRMRMIGTLNHVAAREADRFDAVGFMGDDHRPRTDRWDAELIDDLADGPRIAYGNDLYQGATMATAVFMTSDIIRALGYMAPPTLLHLRADQVWVHWGAAIDRLTYRPDVVIEHVHPYAGKGAWDAGYAEANDDATASADAAAYDAYMDDGGFTRDVDRLQWLMA